MNIWIQPWTNGLMGRKKQNGSDIVCQDPFCGYFTPAGLWSVNITVDHRNTPFICSICDWCLSRLPHVGLYHSYHVHFSNQTTLTAVPPGNILHFICLIITYCSHPVAAQWSEGDTSAATWKHDNKWKPINQRTGQQSERGGGSE